MILRSGRSDLTNELTRGSLFTRSSELLTSTVKRAVSSCSLQCNGPSCIPHLAHSRAFASISWFTFWFQYATVSACNLEENERKYLPSGRIARVVCGGKEGTRKIITGIDGHTVHGQTLRARRLMEIVPGDGETWGPFRNGGGGYRGVGGDQPPMWWEHCLGALLLTCVAFE